MDKLSQNVCHFVGRSLDPKLVPNALSRLALKVLFVLVITLASHPFVPHLYLKINKLQLFRHVILAIHLDVISISMPIFYFEIWLMLILSLELVTIKVVNGYD